MHIKFFDAYSLAFALTQAWPAFSELEVPEEMGVPEDRWVVLLAGLLDPHPAARTASARAQALLAPKRLVI